MHEFARANPIGDDYVRASTVPLTAVRRERLETMAQLEAMRRRRSATGSPLA